MATIQIQPAQSATKKYKVVSGSITHGYDGAQAIRTLEGETCTLDDVDGPRMLAAGVVELVK